MKEIYLAGGCFWGLQKFFDQFDGVVSTEVGYANGPEGAAESAPSYEDVCRSSGHAETVRVVYDETRLSLPELIGYYFMVIDPVAVNRQGNDRGIQYRTGIYFTDPGQYPELRRPLRNFFSAEAYHQKYLEKNPGGYCHIPEKYYHL